jgi:uncharacterized SAM-binding protein YcdF (DUF218 family)
MFRRRKEKRTRLVATAFVLIAVALAAWAWGLILFVDRIPDSVEDEGRHTDAIIVLTGGTLRLEKGFELLSAKMAEKLLVSGVARGVQMEEVLEAAGLKLADLDCCVTLGYMAEDTGSNAIESAVWIRTNKVTSIRLVTSGYHMPRSLLEFRATVPGVEIVPHPVFPEHVMVNEWWARPGTASLVIAEYNKYLLAATRHWLRGIEGE